MPPGAFPMSAKPKRSFRLGSAWRWRIIHFSALEHEFRLLVAYRQDIDEYLAMVGMVVENDTRIIAELCFHGSHPGWHMHFDCGNLTNAPVGVQRWPGMSRRPKGWSQHRSIKLTASGAEMNDNHALDIAANRFQLHTDDLLSYRQSVLP